MCLFTSIISFRQTEHAKILSTSYRKFMFNIVKFSINFWKESSGRWEQSLCSVRLLNFQWEFSLQPGRICHSVDCAGRKFLARKIRRPRSSAPMDIWTEPALIVHWHCTPRVSSASSEDIIKISGNLPKVSVAVKEEKDIIEISQHTSGVCAIPERSGISICEDILNWNNLWTYPGRGIALELPLATPNCL